MGRGPKFGFHIFWGVVHGFPSVTRGYLHLPRSGGHIGGKEYIQSGNARQRVPTMERFRMVVWHALRGAGGFFGGQDEDEGEGALTTRCGVRGGGRFQRKRRMGN